MKYPKSHNVLFVSDRTIWSTLAAQQIQQHLDQVTVVTYDHGDGPIPSVLEKWSGDWIISFKSDIVLQQTVLDSASIGAINFHPALPKYRGVGGYYWALKNNDARYGVTSHFMIEKIDAGPIIEVLDFPILTTDTPSILKDRAGAFALHALLELLPRILNGETIEPTGEQWGKHLYTYDDLKGAGLYT